MLSGGIHGFGESAYNLLKVGSSLSWSFEGEYKIPNVVKICSAIYVIIPGQTDRWTLDTQGAFINRLFLTRQWEVLQSLMARD